MSFRLAKSLNTLRAQINSAYPQRKTDWDGTIASSEHHTQNPNSDHEAIDVGDGNGPIVKAMDLTHDPGHGFDSYKFADYLLSKRDNRIKYVISNGRIAGDEGYASRNNATAWKWAHYGGSNKHDHHVHISVDANKTNYDDLRDWDLSGFGTPVSSHDDVVISVVVYEGSGKGSWYSQFDGNYVWRDSGDAPGSNALGVPDSQQGFAMYDQLTLGKWRDVTAPNGKTLRLQQTDIGPKPSTGRKIDIAAAAADKFGYAPTNFPTDSIFKWSRALPSKDFQDTQSSQKPTLKKSTTSSDIVKDLQKLLGFSESDRDGYFGRDTELSVTRFQRRNALTPDGIVGPATWTILEGSGK